MLCIFERKGNAGIKAFFQYVVLKWKNEQETKAYRIYITDTLKIITENTARFGGGSSVTKRYIEIITPDNPESDETSEEIIDRIKSKLQGGEVE